MKTTSTELPTEPGYYLFYGVPNIDRVDMRCRGEPELVRVARDASQNLLYVGRDVFHNPRRARGIWISVADTLAEVRPEVDQMVLDQAVPRLMAAAFERCSWGMDRTSLIRQVAFPYTDRDGFAIRVVDRAIALGVVVRDPTYSRIEMYKMADQVPPTEPDP